MGKIRQVEQRPAGLEARSSFPEHLVALDDDEWAMWRCVCVRGAGFPVDQVLQLAAPACAAAADSLIQAERARDEALAVLREKLRLVADKYEKHAAREVREQIERQQGILAGALHAVKQGQLPQSTQNDCVEVASLRAACERLAEAQAHFQQAFPAGTLAVSQAIRRVARNERFREAVTWQNRHAIHTGIDALLRYDSEQNAHKQRTKEALVANYLQRYTTKNDTVGFFGPVGCAQLVPEGEAIVVRPAPELLASRSVYFEGWCIDTLAEALAKDRRLWPWFVPRRMPHVHLDGQKLAVPFAKPLALTASQAVVLQACDGIHTAKEIAAELLARSDVKLTGEEEVYSLLEELNTTKRILWMLEVPPESAHPERVLRQLLQRIGDGELRRGCLEKLEALEHAKDAVARAAGHSTELDEAIRNLENIFVELTGVAPTRSGGKAYAARTLVYEDCLRAIDIELGPEMLQTLGQPLAPFLLGARWFTHHIAAFYRQAFMEYYAELAEQLGSPVVDFASFWLWVQPLLFTDDERLVDSLMPVFQERWMGVFSLSENDKRHQVNFTSAELCPRVLAAFDAPGPGWRAACYHSPDILIRASSPEAIREGNYQLVMGELHIAMNTLQIMTFFMQYPHSQAILSYAAGDLPEPRVLPVFSKQYLPFTRVRPVLTTAKDFRLVYAADGCPDAHARVLPLGELVVERIARRLVVRTHDRCCQFDVIEVFAEFLSRLVSGCFKMFPLQKHHPRITVDRMVVARETWSFAPIEIPFANEKTSERRFVHARSWAREHQMPRFVFVKVPGEQKPCFIDFDSPLLVDLLARLVRQERERAPAEVSISISEMLPEPDQAWLPDSAGAYYTSELRFVAVDQLLPYEA